MRFITILSLSFLFLVGCDQVETPPEELIPLRPGQIWTYEIIQNADTSRYSVSLHKGFYVSNGDSVQYRFERLTGHLFIGISPLVLLPGEMGPTILTSYTGVRGPEIVGFGINQRLFKYPATPGEEYPNTYSQIQIGDDSYTISVSEEEIETKMGSMEVLVYKTLKSDWYIKPGLGIVRVENISSSGEVWQINELTSYSPGY